MGRGGCGRLDPLPLNSMSGVSRGAGGPEPRPPPPHTGGKVKTTAWGSARWPAPGLPRGFSLPVSLPDILLFPQERSSPVVSLRGLPEVHLLGGRICPQILQAPPSPPGLWGLASRGVGLGKPAPCLPSTCPPPPMLRCCLLLPLRGSLDIVQPGGFFPTCLWPRRTLHSLPLCHLQQHSACPSPTNPCPLARTCSRPLPPL